MKAIKIIRIIVDITMTVLFMLLMGYHLFENKVHEWLGVTLFILFISHNALNYKWYKTLFKGRYAAVRIIRNVINFVLIVFMVLAMISGIMLSREVFGFLNITAGMTGRRLHMISTAWLYLFMAMHLGLHWGTVVGATRKLVGKAVKKTLTPTLIGQIIYGVIVAGLSGYGIYACIQRQLFDRMFLLMEYAFFDFTEPPVFFFMDYLAILIAFAAVAFYLSKLCRFIYSQRRKKVQKQTTENTFQGDEQ